MKRSLFAIVLASALAVAIVQSASAGPMMAKTGDLNYDGTANSIDAALVLQADAGVNPLPSGDGAIAAAADVNCDKAVNSIDASLILQATAGLYQLRA